MEWPKLKEKKIEKKNTALTHVRYPHFVFLREISSSEFFIERIFFFVRMSLHCDLNFFFHGANLFNSSVVVRACVCVCFGGIFFSALNGVTKRLITRHHLDREQHDRKTNVTNKKERR